MSARPRARSGRTALPTTPVLPPIVAMVATFVDPNAERVSDDFRAIWAEMPAVVQALTDGEGSSVDRVTRYGLVDRIVTRELDASRQAETAYEQRFAELYDRLQAEHEDNITTLTFPYTDASFHVGIALACYLLLAGTEATR